MKRTVKTEIGTFLLESDGVSLVSAVLTRGQQVRGRDSVLDSAADELRLYFKGKLKTFKTSLNPSGTTFQKKIWKAASRIGYGNTLSYKQLSEKAGFPNAYRACGQALNRNPLLVFIPCHRICAADGSLGGYAGGTGVKTALLKLEGET